MPVAIAVVNSGWKRGESLRWIIAFVALLSMGSASCQPADPVAAFIEHQDRLPPDQRVPDWERTKRLMLRTPPAVGDIAPDFTLSTPDGSRTIRMSTLYESRPLVLIFGSFT